MARIADLVIARAEALDEVLARLVSAKDDGQA
jgi:hypothetical protein